MSARARRSPPPPRAWGAGLCDCLQDPSLSCYAVICSCNATGQLYERTSKRGSSCLLVAALLWFLWIAMQSLSTTSNTLLQNVWTFACEWWGGGLRVDRPRRPPHDRERAGLACWPAWPRRRRRVDVLPLHEPAVAAAARPDPLRCVRRHVRRLLHRVLVRLLLDRANASPRAGDREQLHAVLERGRGGARVVESGAACPQR